MLTISQAVTVAYVVGVVGILVGALIVATIRSDRRHARTQDGREVYPRTRLEQILRDELGDEAERYPTDDVLDGMVEDWDAVQRRRGEGR